MVTEIAQIDVKPGTEADFEAGVAHARTLLRCAKGLITFELHKSIEMPRRYRLIAKWETVENHTVDFRGSEDFKEWRSLVGQYFAATPEGEHTVTIWTIDDERMEAHGNRALLFASGHLQTCPAKTGGPLYGESGHQSRGQHVRKRTSPGRPRVRLEARSGRRSTRQALVDLLT